MYRMCYRNEFASLTLECISVVGSVISFYLDSSAVDYSILGQKSAVRKNFQHDKEYLTTTPTFTTKTTATTITKIKTKTTLVSRSRRRQPQAARGPQALLAPHQTWLEDVGKEI